MYIFKVGDRVRVKKGGPHVGQCGVVTRPYPGVNTAAEVAIDGLATRNGYYENDLEPAIPHLAGVPQDYNK